MYILSYLSGWITAIGSQMLHRNFGIRIGFCSGDSVSSPHSPLHRVQVADEGMSGELLQNPPLTDRHGSINQTNRLFLVSGYYLQFLPTIVDYQLINRYGSATCSQDGDPPIIRQCSPQPAINHPLTNPSPSLTMHLALKTVRGPTPWTSPMTWRPPLTWSSWVSITTAASITPWRRASRASSPRNVPKPHLRAAEVLRLCWGLPWIPVAHGPGTSENTQR